MTDKLNIRLLGGLEFLSQVAVRISTRKGALLAAYLAFYRGRTIPRERIRNLLWSDRRDEQAAGSLRRALTDLRKSLAEFEIESVLDAEAGSLCLLTDRTETDVSRFEHLLRSAQVQALVEAADLYRGDLLDGITIPDPAFEDWLLIERRRLRMDATRLVEQLSAVAKGDQELDSTVELANRLLAQEPTCEEAHRALMRCYMTVGRSTAAAHQYNDCQMALDDALGIAPEQKTQDLWTQIAANDHSTILTSPASMPTTGRTEPHADKQVRSETISLIDSDTPTASDRTATQQAELRYVSVLFAAIQHDGLLAEVPDPEDHAERLDAAISGLREVAEQYEGGIVQSLGTELYAVFGGSTAREDHAVEACRAAMAMQDLVLSDDGSLNVEIGVHSGDVILRSPEKRRGERDVVGGMTFQIAKSVSRTSEPGYARISSVTGKEVDGYFAVNKVSEIPALHFPGNLDILELRSATSARNRWEAWAGRDRTKLIGRNGEIEILDRALRHAEQNQGQLVAVAGEPGLGKSRLVDEFLHSISNERCAIIKTDAISIDSGSSYRTIIGLLQTWLDVDDRDTQADIAKKLQSRTEAIGAITELALTALHSLLGLPVVDDAWDTLSTSQRALRISEALKSVLLLESSRQPLVIVIEDLHWLDQASQSVLDRLVASLTGMRILILATHRPEFTHNWNAKSYFQLIRLRPLARTEMEELTFALMGGDCTIETLRQLISTQTDGVPLFAEETVRMLVDEGTLIGSVGAYRMGVPVDRLAVPSSVRTTIAARLEHLSHRAKDLLQTAAVIGRDIPFTLLHSISNEEAQDLSELLDEICEGEFLYEIRPLPEREYRFKHALIEDVTYESVLRKRRTTLHAELAKAMEAHYPERLDEHVERLVHHSERGADYPRTAKYAYLAAKKSISRNAYGHARTYFELALTVLEKLPEEPEWIELAIEIRTRLRSVLDFLGDYKASLEQLIGAERIAAQNGVQSQLCKVKTHRSYLLSSHGEFSSAIQAAHEAQEISRDLGNTEAAAETEMALAQAYCRSGQSQRAIELLRPSIDQWTSAYRYERRGYGGVRSVWRTGTLAHAYCQIGEFDEAQRHATTCREIGEELDHPIDRQMAAICEGLVLTERGLAEQAIPILEKGIELSTANDAPIFFPSIAIWLSSAYSMSGDNKKAVDLAYRAHESAERQKLAHLTNWAKATVARVTTSEKQESDTLALYRKALEGARSVGDRFLEVIILRYIADALYAADAGALPEADKSLEEAISLAERFGYRPQLAHCHLLKSRQAFALDDEGYGQWAEAAQEAYRSMHMQRWIAEIGEIAISNQEREQ